MKRPAWVTISSIVGIVLFCCGLSGLCSTAVIGVVMATPSLVIPSTPNLPPILANTSAISITVLPATLILTPSPSIEFTATLLPPDTVYLSPTETSLPTATSYPTGTTPPTATQSPIHGFVMVDYSHSVSVGGGAHATIQTAPTASCTIKYYTPAGSLSVAQGLEPQSADQGGICSWTWNIGSRTKPGTGRIIITANGVTQQFPIEIV
jgi:hypothetical protein